jgi:hypothetical protein
VDRLVSWLVIAVTHQQTSTIVGRDNRSGFFSVLESRSRCTLLRSIASHFCEAWLTIPKLYFCKPPELEFLQQFPPKLPGDRGRTPATAVRLQKSSVPGEFPRAKSKSKFTIPAQLPQAAGFPCAERSRPKKKGAAGQTGTDLGKNPFRPFPQQLLLLRCQNQPLTGVRS